MYSIMDTCLTCNQSIDPNAKGRKKQYCKRQCWENRIREKICKQCNITFQGTNEKYCTTACRKAYNEANHVKYSLVCEICDQPFEGKTKSTKRCDECNAKGRRRKPVEKRITHIDGKKICIDCGIAKNENEFHKKGKNRTVAECADCSKLRKKNRTQHHFICLHCGKADSHEDKRYTTFCGRECNYEYKKVDRTCETCGLTYNTSTKHTNSTYCQPCFEKNKIDKELAKQIKQIELEKEQQQKVKQKALRQLKSNIAELKKQRFKEEALKNKVCESCSETYEANAAQQKYCEKCKMEKEAIREIIRGKRSEHSLPLNLKRFDKGISIKKLYERDKGICYLCGIKCDWTDRYLKNGHRVTGATYPTREHVIPRSKGGTHTWDNVKLACFKCNTDKGTKDVNTAKKQLEFFL